MEKQYRYKATNKPKPTVCPKCGRKKFSRLIDTYTGKLCGEQYGLCSRCKTLLIPQHGEPVSKPIASAQTTSNDYVEAFDTINPRDVRLSLVHRGDLYNYLCSVFGVEAVDRAWDVYQMGITRSGYVIYWQIDRMGNVRTGECVKYTKGGKRDRNKAEYWIHNVYDRRNGVRTYDDPKRFNLRQCLFGENLVKPGEPVIVVEGAKNALIGYICYPTLRWCAVHSRGEFNEKKLYPIRQSPITAIPDKDALEDWQEKAEELNGKGYSIKVIDYEALFNIGSITAKLCTDIADALIYGRPYELPANEVLRRIVERNPAVGLLCRALRLEPV